ncbi:MAG TPA: hypothetical protein VF595_00380 [Tepidisphaeraceae bacterium]
MTSPDHPQHSTRRDFLRGVGGVMAAGAIAPAVGTGTAYTTYPIALGDRVLGARQQAGHFAVAARAGATGLEVDLGRLGSGPAMENRLLDPAVRRQFAEAAAEANMTICSFALGAFTHQSFASHPNAEAYVGDLLYVMKQFDVRVGVLPFGQAADLNDGFTRQQCAARLKSLASQIESSGAVLALDAPVDAPVDARLMRTILDDIGSPAITACVTAGPSLDAAGAFALLGGERVAQIRVQHGAPDLAALRQRADAAGWSGWLVLDRHAMTADDLTENCAAAVRDVRDGFSVTIA